MLESIERRLNPPEPEYPFPLNKTRIRQLDALAQKIGKQAPVFWQLRDLIPVAEEETRKLLADWVSAYRRDRDANLAALASHNSERRRKSFAVIAALFLTGILLASSTNGSSVFFLLLAFQYWIVWVTVDFNRQGTSAIGRGFRKVLAKAYFRTEFVPIKSDIAPAPSDWEIQGIALVVATKARKTITNRKSTSGGPKRR